VLTPGGRSLSFNPLAPLASSLPAVARPRARFWLCAAFGFNFFFVCLQKFPPPGGETFPTANRKLICIFPSAALRKNGTTNWRPLQLPSHFPLSALVFSLWPPTAKVPPRRAGYRPARLKKLGAQGEPCEALWPPGRPPPPVFSHRQNVSKLTFCLRLPLKGFFKNLSAGTLRFCKKLY